MFSGGLADWLKRLESLHPSAIALGLERVAEVARRADCTELDCPIVTIAGTNGKGSAAAALEAFVGEAGGRAGCYTSPHLFRYNERVRIGGRAVDDGALVRAFEAVERARGEVPLTYFEFGTVAALVLFKAAALDLAILEVGLGGRLDAVNIVDPTLAVITSIGLDHQSWLGDDIDSIAREKAGIMREGIPVVLADPVAPPVLADRAAGLNCRLLRPDESLLADFAGAPLRAENLAAAWLAARELNVRLSPEAARRSARSLALPGRAQWLRCRGNRVLLDVAHNPAAVENLMRELGDASAVALFAVLSDKDIHAMIRRCRGRFAGWHPIRLPGVARAAPAERVAAMLSERGEQVLSVDELPEAALRLAFENMTGEQTLVVFGSFHTVAAVLPRLDPKLAKQ